MLALRWSRFPRIPTIASWRQTQYRTHVLLQALQPTMILKRPQATPNIPLVCSFSATFITVQIIMEEIRNDNSGGKQRYHEIIFRHNAFLDCMKYVVKCDLHGVHFGERRLTPLLDIDRDARFPVRGMGAFASKISVLYLVSLRH